MGYGVCSMSFWLRIHLDDRINIHQDEGHKTQLGDDGLTYQVSWIVPMTASVSFTQWNLYVMTTSMIKFIVCDLFSNVF